MTVNSTINRTEHNGDGATTGFVFPPYFLDDDDLKVFLRDSSTDVETLQVLSNDYTISGAADPAGGTVTFSSPPDADEKVVIIRDPDRLQSVDYQANDAFPAETHERALDKLTMIVQRLAEQRARTIGLAETDTATTLTLPSDRNNTLLGFKVSGEMEAVSKSTLSGATLPGTTVDNSLPRFDGIDGDALQGSGITVDDGGNMDVAGTGYLKAAVGTTAQAPEPATVGMIRYDNTLAKLRSYIAGAWHSLAITTGPNEFGGGQRFKTQSPAFNASPEPDATLGQRVAFPAATGAVTIGAMSNCHVGMPFRFILLQDGVGGRAYTMDAAYLNQPLDFVTSPNKRQIIDGEVTAVDGSNNMTEAVLSLGSWIES